MSEDPIKYKSGDLNFYNSFFNSPISITDPSGLVAQPDCLGANVLETDEGIQMLINSYVNEARRSPIGAGNVYQEAHSNAQTYRVGTGENNIAISSAEHYLWTRGEVQAGGYSNAAVQSISTVGYTGLKALLQPVGGFSSASPASATQVKWGAKGIFDGL